MGRLVGHALGLAICLGLSCQCNHAETQVDAGDFDGGVHQTSRDAGHDAGGGDSGTWAWPSTYASEPCPASLLETSRADGGLEWGICVVLKTLTAEALLDDNPETKPVKVQFVGSGFQSELSPQPDAQGLLTVRVMRGFYDGLQHRPAGVWPSFDGFVDHGPVDMTVDQRQYFRAKSHALRGAARFGGVAFRPNTFPQDVWFTAFGSPARQQSTVTSVGGAYELRMVEGAFSLYLSTPASSLFGTELRQFLVTAGKSVTFDRDQEFDLDLATSVLEGTLTIDGRPLADAKVGPDYAINFTSPGAPEASVRSHHEGGLAEFTALVPRGIYGTTLDFDGAPNRTWPARIVGRPLQASVDLNHDTMLNLDLSTRAIEGAVLIDGVPPPPNPNVNLEMLFFGIAGATQADSFLHYQVPMESASFLIRAFPGNYFVVLRLSDDLAEGLAAGFWVVDRYLQVQDDRTMAVALDTATLRGRIFIDGENPVRNLPLGTLSFRNRALDGQYSWFSRALTSGDDGSFSVKLPKGEYEVYFTIDPETYPMHASGRQRLISRLPLESDATVDLHYDTVEIHGPLRVNAEPVADRIAGPEVGLSLRRQEDFQTFGWRFFGGEGEYRLRIPSGSYVPHFVVFENGLEQVAFGDAPMGVRINVDQPGEPFMAPEP